jgi:flagellar hook-associated protein FlgK
MDLLSSFRLSNGAAGTARAAVGIAQENMANALDPGYAKRTSTIEVDITQGHITGLRTGLPQRVVDIKIIAAKRDQNSTVKCDEVRKDLLEQLDDLMGDLDQEGGAIHKKLTNIAEKAAALTIETSSPTGRRNAIEAVKDFTNTVQAFAKGIDEKRNFAEKGVIASVKTVNELANKLYSLNQQLAQVASSGEGIDLSTLDNEREKIVESLAKVMDITVVYAENSIFVYTSAGQPIVENKVYEVSYQSSGIIDYSAEYPTNINPIYLVDDRGNKVDITLVINQGQLGGYLEIRDDVCPAYQKTLDKFVEVFKEKVNHVHNKGAGFPPAAELNGKYFVKDADKNTAVDWKADSVVRIAFVDDKGNFADPGGGTFYVDLNLNLGGLSALTPSEIRDQINTALGDGVASFSEGDDFGYLTLQAPTGFRMVIGSVDGQTPGETDGGVGFSEFFKLNDLLESISDPLGRGHSNSFKVVDKISKDPALFSAGRLKSAATIAVTDSAITAGDGRILAEFRNVLTTPDVAFSAVGVMSAQTTSFMEYISNFVNTLHLATSDAINKFDFSFDVLDGLEERHSRISGVNNDDEMAEIMIQQIYYSMLMKSSQKLLEMVHEMLDVMGNS